MTNKMLKLTLKEDLKVVSVFLSQLTHILDLSYFKVLRNLIQT